MSLFTKALRKNRELEKNQPGALAKITKSKIALLIGMALMTINSASAASVNWTEITEVIDGFVAIVPSFAAMISAIMPVLLMIALYTFIIRFWDKILDAMDGAFHFR